MREIAKFFSGFSANQVLTHGAMAITGTQFTIFGITYGLGLNMMAVFVWAAVSLVLVYHAWIRPWQ
jgi:hypothetical protein